VGVLWQQNNAMGQYLIFRAVLEGANLIFLVTYTGEMALKIAGLGLKEYLSRGPNLLDGTIVCIGFYEFGGVLVLFTCFLNATRDYVPTDNYVVPCVENNAALTVLRAFRLVRLVKFFRRFPSFQLQVTRMVEMIKPVSTLGVLIALFLFIFCILGMVLLGGSMYVPPTFDTLIRGDWVYLQLPNDNLPTSLSYSLYMRGRPGVVETIDAVHHPLNAFRVSKRLTFSSLPMNLKESSSSTWAAISTGYSSSPPSTVLTTAGGTVSAGAEQGAMMQSSIQSASAYGPFEIAPFELTAGETDTGLRQEPQRAAIANKVPRANFDTFGAALLSVLQVLTTTDWQYVMYNAAHTNGNAISLYFYLLLFGGNYVLMNLFVSLVIVGFGSQQGQLQTIERDDRKVAAERFKAMRLIKESIYQQLSQDLCGFPGPNCAEGHGGLSLWHLLPFREDIEKHRVARRVKLEEDDDDDEAVVEVVVEERAIINHDYVQIHMSVRAAARQILGSVDWGFLGASHPQPQLADVERVLMDLRTLRVASKRRGAGGVLVTGRDDEELEDSSEPDGGGSGKAHGKRGKQKHGKSVVIPALLFKSTGTVEERGFYVAVEFLYKFWDKIETQTQARIKAKTLDTELTDEEMMDIMRLIIQGQDLSVASQARMNAGEATAGNMLKLKLPDGSARCQGMVGNTTQCPRGLDCNQHRKVNERFLNSYQMLKTQGKNSLAGAYEAHHLEVEKMRVRLKGASGNSKYNVPYIVCGIVTWDMSLRKNAGRALRSPWFDKIIIYCIYVNCAVLAIERPRRSDLESLITYWVQFSLTATFWAEMLTKMLWYGPALYLQNAFNKIDVLVNVLSAVEIAVYALVLSTNSSALESFRVLRIFRALRALRPLRLIARSPGLRIMMTTVTSSVKPISNLMVMSFIVFAVLAILGIQLLSGKLARCNDNTVFEITDCTGVSVLGTPRVWEQATINFNWIGDALVAVYVISSQDHWPDLMHQGMDATTAETGPSVNTSR